MSIARLRELEGLALELAREPKVQAARETAWRGFLEEPYAKTKDGLASVHDAADQHFWGALLLALNADPHRPEAVPLFLYAHEIGGQAYPSALHGGLENPDNVYRIIPVSPDSRYVLTGRRHDPAPAQVTYELMDAVPGLGGLGEQISLLMDRGMTVAADGAFTITLDTDPANGRANHIRLTPEARCLFVRDTLSDWETQTADTLSVARTGGPDALALSREALIAEAARIVPIYADFWRQLPKTFRARMAYKTNAFDPPYPRTGGWGFIANTHVQVGPDEAFVFTVDPRPAPYHGVLVGNHWWIAADADRKSGAFTPAQAKADADGRITYVIASRDPGVWNWLDTGGLSEGIIQVRWQGTPPEMTALPDGISGGEVMKIADLQSRLRPETVWVTPAERKAQLAARHASYLRRLSPP